MRSCIRTRGTPTRAHTLGLCIHALCSLICVYTGCTVHALYKATIHVVCLAQQPRTIWTKLILTLLCPCGLSIPLYVPVLRIVSYTPTGDERLGRGPKDLSNEPHYTPDAEHNPDYDHDAFLGKEQAERFDQLSPKEAKRRLG